MGQYFRAINLDKDESLDFGMLKFVERLANPEWTAALAYLLFEGPQDGTTLPSNGYVPDEYEGLTPAQSPLYDALHEGLRDRLVKSYKTADTKDERERIARRAVYLAEANVPISERYDYAGRWAGDRITIVGDYADSGLYDMPADDVSDGVRKEMKELGLIDDWVHTRDGDF